MTTHPLVLIGQRHQRYEKCFTCSKLFENNIFRTLRHIICTSRHIQSSENSASTVPGQKKPTANFQKSDLSCLDRKFFLSNQGVIIPASWYKNIFSPDNFLRRKTVFSVLKKAEILGFFPPHLSKSHRFCIQRNSKNPQAQCGKLQSRNFSHPSKL